MVSRSLARRPALATLPGLVAAWACAAVSSAPEPPPASTPTSATAVVPDAGIAAPPSTPVTHPPAPATGEPDGAAPWTFAAISDLHVGRNGSVPRMLPKVVRAVVAEHPRFVVVLGDFTDGMKNDPLSTQGKASEWWRVVQRELSPIREAGIAVLPVAGNHDTELAVYQRAYRAAWRDLERWAAPLPIHGEQRPGYHVAFHAMPFSYSTDVDDVHLTIAHVVSEKVDRKVSAFIERDLARARDATLRFVLAHVPVFAVGNELHFGFDPAFPHLLQAGRADVYVAGHEHLCWDEMFPLPGGGEIHEIVVGTASSRWRYGPNPEARRRAHCRRISGSQMSCHMPRSGAGFELRLENDRWLQEQPHTLTLVTVDGHDVTTRVLSVDRQGVASPLGTAHAGGNGP